MERGGGRTRRGRGRRDPTERAEAVRGASPTPTRHAPRRHAGGAENRAQCCKRGRWLEKGEPCEARYGGTGVRGGRMPRRAARGAQWKTASPRARGGCGNAGESAAGRWVGDGRGVEDGQGMNVGTRKCGTAAGRSRDIDPSAVGACLPPGGGERGARAAQSPGKRMVKVWQKVQVPGRPPCAPHRPTKRPDDEKRQALGPNRPRKKPGAQLSRRRPRRSACGILRTHPATGERRPQRAQGTSKRTPEMGCRGSEPKKRTTGAEAGRLQKPNGQRRAGRSRAPAATRATPTRKSAEKKPTGRLRRRAVGDATGDASTLRVDGGHRADEKARRFNGGVRDGSGVGQQQQTPAQAIPRPGPSAKRSIARDGSANQSR